MSGPEGGAARREMEPGMKTVRNLTISAFMLASTAAMSANGCSTRVT
jgi:hypothetical protein